MENLEELKAKYEQADHLVQEMKSFFQLQNIYFKYRSPESLDSMKAQQHKLKLKLKQYG